MYTELSNRNKELLLNGAKTTGSFTEGYYYIEESLYGDEANELYSFCEWIESITYGDQKFLDACVVGPTGTLHLIYDEEHGETVRQLFGKGFKEHAQDHFNQEDLKQILDYEFYHRLLKYYKIVVIENVLVKFRLHHAQATIVNKGQGSLYFNKPYTC